jgi:pimeloyl-ACP methyl ester carboxylesterase
MHRRFLPARQYTLADMADDAAGLLAGLRISPAHLLGASMGGAIAQTLTARHPEGVRSLTSIMSNTGHRRKGQPALTMYRHLLRPPPRGRAAYIDYTARLFKIIGSPDLPRDLEEVRERAARSYDRGYDPAATRRQLAAIIASGDRTAQLGEVSAPTLVIHGAADRLVKPSGGRATAQAIPGARLITIEGMGHDLPRAVWPRVIDAFTEHARRADGERQAA